VLNVPYTVTFALNVEHLSMYRVIESASMRSMLTHGRRALSHRPHRSRRTVFIATDSLLMPRAAYSSMYESSNRSHLLIVARSKRKKAGELALARRYVIETNNMTPDMTALGVGKGPELN
jgi:hypothetical protein